MSSTSSNIARILQKANSWMTHSLRKYWENPRRSKDLRKLGRTFWKGDSID
jgi:hypothetical protein